MLQNLRAVLIIQIHLPIQPQIPIRECLIAVQVKRLPKFLFPKLQTSRVPIVESEKQELFLETPIFESASKDSYLVGTHYRGAKVTILDVTTVPNSLGGTTDWYKIEVTSYGSSMAPDKYGENGKDPGSGDVGWVNSYPEVYENNRKVRRTLIDFD